MKRLFLAILLASGLVGFRLPPDSNTEDFKWYTWEEMVVANKENPKPIFIDVYTDWCGWCKKMDRTTFRNPKIQKILSENFYPVKFNAEQKSPIHFMGTELKYVRQGRGGYHQLAAALLDGQLSFPTTVILNSKFERILLSPGYKHADDLGNELEYVSSGAYKQKDWNSFLKSQ